MQIDFIGVLRITDRSVFVIVSSAGFKILLSILVILLRRVFLSVRKLGQWGRNSYEQIVMSDSDKEHLLIFMRPSQPQVRSGFNVSWKLFVNLFHADD